MSFRRLGVLGGCGEDGREWLFAILTVSFGVDIVKYVSLGAKPLLEAACQNWHAFNPQAIYSTQKLTCRAVEVVNA